MFKKRDLKAGSYVFVAQKDGDFKRIIIGRIQSLNGSKLRIAGSYVRPTGLMQKVQAGSAGSRPREVLANPDPNNCIFILIDRVESGSFNDVIDESVDSVTWINENRFLVIDGWVKENLPDIFANALTAGTDGERSQARATLVEKMDSLYERDLKEHVYAVARSAKIL